MLDKNDIELIQEAEKEFKKAWSAIIEYSQELLEEEKWVCGNLTGENQSQQLSLVRSELNFIIREIIKLRESIREIQNLDLTKEYIEMINKSFPK